MKSIKLTKLNYKIQKEVAKMRIYLDEKRLRYDIFELVRTFIPKEEIFFEGEDREFLKIEYEKRKVSLHRKGETRVLNIPYIDEEKDQRRAFKRGVLELLEKSYGSTSSWGILTGIRPVKIIQELMDKGMSLPEIKTYMRKEYLIEEDKNDLLLNIASRQRRYLYPIKEDSYSLYINIPFCPTRCDYCSFPTILYKKKDYRKEYVDLILREMKEVSKALVDKKLQTVYIGGGTPTALEQEDLKRILIRIKENFGSPIEWTVEAGREDTLSVEVLSLLKGQGITRISLNPQSFHERTIKEIGRVQNNQRLIELFYKAKEIGFNSINMDFILGLPGEGIEELEYNLKRIEELQPDNLTVHTLSIKRGSKFMERNKDLAGEGSIIGEMIERVQEYIKNSSYEPYYLYRQKQILGNFENIGYSLPGKESLYNMYMMEERQSVIGIGMTANTKIIMAKENRVLNYRNYKNLKDYTINIEKIIEEKKRLLGGEIIERS